MTPTAAIPLRWTTAEEEAEAALFPDETALGRHVGTGAYAGMEFLHVNARSVINAVPAASRVPFRFTINPYRGCSHACTYCFARPTHRYLGLDPGEDFERRIVVKVNAVERLRAELRAPSWAGEHVAMGTNTDPYQHAEGKYHLTQGIVRELGEARNPFSILTKSTLVLRDLGLLTAAARRAPVHCCLSVGTLDTDVWRLTEPGTPPPEQRLAAVRRLNEAGVPCGVLVAPVIPGLSDADEQVRGVVRAAAEAGAVSVAAVALHLRPGVREHYMAWLAANRPDLVAVHDRLFRGGAYQPKAQGRRLQDLVASTLADTRPRTPRPRAAEHAFGHRAMTERASARRPATDAPAGDGEQLRLL